MNRDKNSLNGHDKAFVDKTRGLLNDSANELDGMTATRLGALRKQAMAQRNRRQTFFGAPRLTAAGAFASIAIIATVWIIFPVSGTGVFDTEDVMLLSAKDDMELIDELEFYAWLADEENLS